jgi:hypothetical protein
MAGKGEPMKPFDAGYYTGLLTASVFMWLVMQDVGIAILAGWIIMATSINVFVRMKMVKESK